MKIRVNVILFGKFIFSPFYSLYGRLPPPVRIAPAALTPFYRFERFLSFGRAFMSFRARFPVISSVLPCHFERASLSFRARFSVISSALFCHFERSREILLEQCRDASAALRSARHDKQPAFSVHVMTSIRIPALGMTSNLHSLFTL